MRAVVLEYHDVVAADYSASGFPGAAADSYKLRQADFLAHLDALASSSAPVVNDVRQLEQSSATPERPVVITFDDGGAGAMVAADCLERHGWRGHFLMTTSRIGSPGFLTPAELRTLHARGHVVGSHSRTHPTRMAKLDRRSVATEWSESCTSLSEVLGAPIDVASVPGGYYAPWIAAEAARAGIRWLFTSEPLTSVDVVDGCRVLGRYTLRQDSPAARVAALVTPRSFARVSEWSFWNAKKLAKWAAGDAYLRLRSSLLGDRPRASRVNPPDERSR